MRSAVELALRIRAPGHFPCEPLCTILVRRGPAAGLLHVALAMAGCRPKLTALRPMVEAPGTAGCQLLNGFGIFPALALPPGLLAETLSAGADPCGMSAVVSFVDWLVVT